MEKLFEFRVNSYIDRNKVVSALAEAGYTVTVETKEQLSYSINRTDCFVVITGRPELPEYIQ